MKNYNKKFISVVIVTYNPSEKLPAVIENLKKQVGKIYIIDNNSNSKDMFNKITPDSVVEIIYYDKNIGLAAAQNIGIKRSIEEKMEWILFLDDDSEVGDDFLEKLLYCYGKVKNKEQVAIIGANILHDNSSKQTAYPVKTNFFIKRVFFKKQDCIEDVMFVISSGSIMKTKLFTEIGLFIEEFFVDHIDVEFCLRVNNLGYKILASKEAKLYQRVGGSKEKNIFGIKSYPTNHNPQRQYTKYRNAVLTWKKYFFKEPKYVVYDMLLMTNHFLRIVIFEDNKLMKIKQVFKGIFTGILMKL